jgi:CubicO group peptidase (beta-lactamase class C family)
MTALEERVRQLADELVRSGRETGLQVAVYSGGEQIVDVVAGVADSATGCPVSADTPFYAYSVGKAMTATIVHMLAGQVAFAGTDEIFGMPSAWTLGFARGGPGTQPGEQTTWFGWGGVGGAYAGADSATGTTLAVSKNRLSADFTTAAQIGAVVTG